AMDILYTGEVDGFCIVSSDSDFTRLATRLREAGKKVIGIGEKKTLTPFISACDKFIYIEILKKNESDSEGDESTKKSSRTTKSIKTNAISKVDPKIIKLFRDSISDLEDEDGWAFLGELGNLMLKKKPDFDPRNYGFNKMLPFMKSLNKFEVDERDSGKGNIKHIYVKIK
ncbi:MAG: Fe-S-cluster formation regulator IscX/YfhJ, partial [Flavobacterium sp.]